MTISGERTKQLDIFCRVTGFTSDFLSFIVVELIRFFHGAIQMMPPADQIYDPGQGAKKDPTETGDDFLAIGPALRIMQLNVEGLSAAKREVISSIAVRQKIDVICLEETHVHVDKTNHFSIAGFDLLAYSLHATYVRDNISDAHHVTTSVCYDVIRIGSYHVANIYKPPSENWGTTNTLPVLPHPSSSGS